MAQTASSTSTSTSTAAKSKAASTGSSSPGAATAGGSPAAAAAGAACAACFRSHVKCRAPPGGEACARCVRLGLLCVPRTPGKRGRPLAAHSERLKMRRSDSDQKPGKDVEMQFGASKHSLAELRNLEAWTCCHAFQPRANSAEQYQAAAALLAMSRELGFDKGHPRPLYWFIRTQIAIARADHSVSVLHAATTLSMSQGFRKMNFESPKRDPHREFSPNARAVFQSATGLSSVDVRAGEHPGDFGPVCYRIEVREGRRLPALGAAFSKFFMSEIEAARPLSNEGNYKLYPELVERGQDRIRFTTSCMRSTMVTQMVIDAQGREEMWHAHFNLGDVLIRDRFGRRWLVDAVQHDVGIVAPLRYLHNVQFRNFRLLKSKPGPSPLLRDLPPPGLHHLQQQQQSAHASTMSAHRGHPHALAHADGDLAPPSPPLPPASIHHPEHLPSSQQQHMQQQHVQQDPDMNDGRLWPGSFFDFEGDQFFGNFGQLVDDVGYPGSSSTSSSSSSSSSAAPSAALDPPAADTKDVHAPP